VFSESINSQLDINIEKAKMYVVENGGIESDLVYLVNEARNDASDRLYSALHKFQEEAEEVYDNMADDTSKFADSAKFNVATNKIQTDPKIGDKEITINISVNNNQMDRCEADLRAKLAVLDSNPEAVIPQDKLDKSISDADDAIKNAGTEKKSFKLKVKDAIEHYRNKVKATKDEVNASKEKTKKIKNVTKDKAKWNKKSPENKKQTSVIVSKLTSIFNKKIEINKKDAANISKSIKSPKKSLFKKESSVPEILNNVLDDLFEEKYDNLTVSSDRKIDELLVAIESEIEADEIEHKNNIIDDLNDITFDESTDIDSIVNDMISELI
jgi:hypothetical protein